MKTLNPGAAGRRILGIDIGVSGDAAIGAASPA